MSRVVGDKLRARMDAAAKHKREQAREDAEYAVPGWKREVDLAPPDWHLERVVERKVSSGHKVTYKVVQNG